MAEVAANAEISINSVPSDAISFNFPGTAFVRDAPKVLE